MVKKSKRNSRKIKNLIIVCALSSFVFVVSTYAWFIGMRTVNVSSFDVSIATTDSLLLSLDGKKWNTTVEINGNNFNDPTVVYGGNANTWSEGGLIPVSSVGEMDVASSRMKLYEKGSLTPTKGGYRLMASQMDNFTKNVDDQLWQFKEERGYVAFDLFVKNLSGREYYAENNEANEEAIYLTTDSVVSVAKDGIKNTGIENSVRVAFAQIGRVNAKVNNPATITGITCTSSEESNPVTGICRTAQIWEPNEKGHVQSAIDNFAKTCKNRNTEGGESVFAAEAYADLACSPISNGTATPTYAIKTPITSATSSDIYDGLNTFSTNSNLFNYDTFTDEERDLPGNQRKQFISLAPNSITKVRVYIYIEGQDVDNFDLASIGKKISVAFGLTKDRYDFDDQDTYIQNVIKNDHTNPVISFADTSNVQTSDGVNKLTIEQGAPFDAKALVTANDAEEGIITPRIQVVNNTVNPSEPGKYLVSYLVSDWAGNYTQVDLEVTVNGGV